MRPVKSTWSSWLTRICTPALLRPSTNLFSNHQCHRFRLYWQEGPNPLLPHFLQIHKGEDKMRRIPLLLALCFCCFVQAAFAQANGKLQIHFMDVGKGDGAVLISPLGEVVLFDDGVNNQCEKPVSYLTQLGITKIDYLIVSHYHADHIGCTRQVLNHFPLQKQSVDRGATYNSGSFNVYVQTVG